MREAKYFLEQAERCFRLARAITDREATGKLEAMGVEFMSKAVELDGNLAPLAVPARAGARSS
jgi:glutathionylspermidine synthase